MSALTLTRTMPATREIPVRRVEVFAPELGVGLVLRRLEDGDQGAFVRALRESRMHLRRWFPTNGASETDDAYFERQVARAIEGDATGTAWRRAAFDDAGRFVGVVNINRIERGLDWKADLCWWVAAARSGRGLGTRIVAAAVDHALADMPEGLGLGRVHAGIHPENAASVRVAQKLGFRPDPRYTSRLLVGGSWQAHDAWVKSAVVG
ncbi:MAG: hypothetical protein DHS20C14_12340 [Phycisphaeraceae bacterium]|nr:MAG: hypothetical protein DHS20C14_12340 [Phycisphaeraceae bacterium]